MDQKNEKQGLTPEELQAFYAKAKQEFKPEDLKMFFTDEEGIPLDEFIKELEAKYRKAGGDPA